MEGCVWGLGVARSLSAPSSGFTSISPSHIENVCMPLLYPTNRKWEESTFHLGHRGHRSGVTHSQWGHKITGQHG